MTDRADEIARGIVLESLQPSTLSNTREERIEQAIAAALRSYGDERLEKVLTVCDGLSSYGRMILRQRVRALKFKPEIQEGKA